MKVNRPSSQAEYAVWYLDRERRKSGSHPALSDPAAAVAAVNRDHPGKWRSWFDNANWSLLSLTLDEFSRLVFPEISWTKDEGLTVDDLENYRLLRRVAERAIEIDYLDRPSAGKHRRYHEELERGLRLEGADRVAICSAEAELGRNPAASHYLLDGAGRSLPYLILVQRGRLEYQPVEAHCADLPG